MKTKLLIALFLLSTISVLHAQDVIVKQNGDEIQAKVTEVGISDIKYKKYGNDSGPTYVIAKADVFMIKYEGGTTDVFKQTPSNTNSTVQNGRQSNTNREPRSSREPREPRSSRESSSNGQNVNNNRNANNYQEQYPTVDDQYSTPSARGYHHKYAGLSFGLSFLYPGIGQFYNGQVGKGVTMVVLATGSLATILGVSSSLDTDSSGNAVISDGQAVAVGAAALIYTFTWIWGMIDAPISSGVINRRNQALSWNLGKDRNLSITPDVISSNSLGMMKTNYQAPAYGLSLKLDF